MDKAERIVLPKPLRERLGLVGGDELEVVEHDGVVELRPAPADVEVLDTPDGAVVAPRESLPQLDDASLRETLDRLRR